MPRVFTDGRKKWHRLHFICAVIITTMGISIIVSRYTLIDDSDEGPKHNKRGAIKIMMFMGSALLLLGLCYITYRIHIIHRQNKNANNQQASIRCQTSSVEERTNFSAEIIASRPVSYSKDLGLPSKTTHSAERRHCTDHVTEPTAPPGDDNLDLPSYDDVMRGGYHYTVYVPENYIPALQIT